MEFEFGMERAVGEFGHVDPLDPGIRERGLDQRTGQALHQVPSPGGDQAHGRGMEVAAHAHSRSGIELAIRNGVHDIQHISFMDEALVDLAAEHGCVVTPTSWVMDELQRADGLSDFVMDKVKQVAEVHAQATAYAAKGGLPILMGTDPVLPGMHGRNGMEIAALVKEGLSPLAAWHGTTGLAAEHIHVPETGTIEPGKRADLLVCTEDVVHHPEKLGAGAILEVLKDGEGYRGGLDGVPQRRFETDLRERLAKRG